MAIYYNKFGEIVPLHITANILHIAMICETNYVPKYKRKLSKTD